MVFAMIEVEQQHCYPVKEHVSNNNAMLILHCSISKWPLPLGVMSWKTFCSAICEIIESILPEYITHLFNLH